MQYLFTPGDINKYFGNSGVWVVMAVFILLAAWSMVWKGLALWKAARREEKWWFIPLLVINTVGILEILYIFVFSRRSKKVSSATLSQPQA